jgi:aromatic-L-amino-acid decarboxylase
MGFGEGRGERLVIYTSEEAHSSVEKGAKIAGFGKGHLRLIPTGEDFAMIPKELERAIEKDKQEGLIPCCVVATVGTTSSTAMDPLPAIGEICARYGAWLHVDAAMAGTAAILPEMRHILNGVELADSFVFNPHKWMFTSVDCSAYFCKQTSILKSTFGVMPEYLKTNADQLVNNYKDWGISLGRRFRALKLWFVMRSFGVVGLQKRVREHIALAGDLASWIGDHPEFEILAPVSLNLVCFRHRPSQRLCSEEEMEQINKALMDRLNRSGEMFFTHTKLNGKFTLRLCVGQTHTTREHVEKAWEKILREVECGFN